MCKIFILFFLTTFNVFCQSDTLSVFKQDFKLTLNNSKYMFLEVTKKISSNDLIVLFNDYENGIVFFYPIDDSIKKNDYEEQIITLSKNNRFKNAKIIGVPYFTGVTDEENVFFDNHIVTNVECFIYTKDLILLNRALNLKKDFNKETSNLPLSFYLVNINTKSICVKEKRIEFCNSLIYEFLDPIYSQSETIEILKNKIIILENSNKGITEKLLFLEQQIELLKKNNK